MVIMVLQAGATNNIYNDNIYLKYSQNLFN